MDIMVSIEVGVLLGVILLIIGADVVFLALGRDDDEDTFSALSRSFGGLNPFWPLCWGLLAGRFFHWWEIGDNAPIVEQPWGIIIAGAIILALVLFFGIASLCGASWWKDIRSNWGIPGAFVIGYLLGALFWPVESLMIDFEEI